ncbi:MAG: hypothetical protein FJW23_06835 [Acidimicrobiia bacterium]|nr:hypothetical protein [Acidimicrobiia bacterium]
MLSSLLRRLGLWLLPLFQPTREEDQRARDRVTESLRGQARALDVQQRRVEALQQNVRELTEAVHGTARAVVDGLDRQSKAMDAAERSLGEKQGEQTRRLRTTLSRHSAFLKGVLGATRYVSEKTVARQQVEERLARIAAGGRPLLIGPWTGEVGFELLYWIPFVRWFVERYSVDPARLIVVSRGGPVSWYGELASRYLDVLQFLTPEALGDPAHVRKQRRLSMRDRRLIRAVTGAVGTRVSVLHPGYLYQMAAGYLDGMTGVRPMLELLRHRRITPPPRTLVPGLPPEYVAAKFYFSDAFPDVPENRRFVDQLLAQAAEQYPVVLLDQGARVDDHPQYLNDRHATLTSLGATVTPAGNLDVQTSVVGHARAFLGTYGGFSYLAPMCGVETVVFHAGGEFYLHHRHLADEAFASIQARPLTVLPVRAFDAVGGPDGPFARHLPTPEA